MSILALLWHYIDEVQSRYFIENLLEHKLNLSHFTGHGGAEQKLMLRNSDRGDVPL
jgi:hypothetical protein